jgi:putative endonuclease
MPRPGFVYILASRRNGTLYIGVTSDLVRRLWLHRHGIVEGFSRRYGVHRLVFYEHHEDIRGAIAREKQLKKWRREWKVDLIERTNPRWKDLYDDVVARPR